MGCWGNVGGVSLVWLGLREGAGEGVKRAISCVLPADESAPGAHSDTAALRIAAGEQRQ
jgi:hypothetical protein